MNGMFPSQEGAPGRGRAGGGGGKRGVEPEPLGKPGQLGAAPIHPGRFRVTRPLCWSEA